MNLIGDWRYVSLDGYASFRSMEIGQVLEMVATDPGVVPDMEAWEKQTRHEILQTDQVDEETWRFYIKKTHE